MTTRSEVKFSLNGRVINAKLQLNLSLNDYIREHTTLKVALTSYNIDASLTEPKEALKLGATPCRAQRLLVEREGAEAVAFWHKAGIQKKVPKDRGD